MGLNIIGDVAGQYKCLRRLLEKMPHDPVLLVGDIIDRGPNSKKVVKWARNAPHVNVLKGNHEDMMIDFVLKERRYQDMIWFYNGGGQTCRSYFPNLATKDLNWESVRDELRGDADWMKTLPVFYEEPGLFVSHAPIHFREHADSEPEFDLIWNRNRPRLAWIDGTFLVHGHNSRDKVLWYRDEGIGNHQEVAWGINIDTSQAAVLTGIHWPTKTLYEEPYELGISLRAPRV